MKTIPVLFDMSESILFSVLFDLMKANPSFISYHLHCKNYQDYKKIPYLIDL